MFNHTTNVMSVPASIWSTEKHTNDAIYGVSSLETIESKQ